MPDKEYTINLDIAVTAQNYDEAYFKLIKQLRESKINKFWIGDITEEKFISMSE